MEGDAPIVGWYRRDDTRRLLWILLPAMIPPVLGSLLIGLSYPRIDNIDPLGVRHHYAEEFPDVRPEDEERAGFRDRRRAQRPHPHAGPIPRNRGEDIAPEDKGSVWLLFAFGLGMVIAGPAIVIWGLRRSWRREGILMLRIDGLVHENDGTTQRVPWEEIEVVRYDDGEDAITVLMRGEAQPILIHEKFAGISKEQLAKQVEDVRRKAMFNLLPQQR
ncbi:MAG: hypothetical protein AAGE52_01055 [Myxococcota bacterium]